MDVVWMSDALVLWKINNKIMANHLWKVTAKRDSFSISKGMNVEILVKNASRKLTQKEVITAINEKYGE